MVKSTSTCVGGLLAATLCLATCLAWEVPLTVEEQQGVSGPRRLTCGVPLLAGQAKDVKQLRLLAKDADGKTTPVPAQFGELARWWRADNSIRWVLVDFATDMGAKQTKTFVLTDGKVDAPPPPARLTVQQDDNLITVSTGPARFVVNRKKFNFLDQAIVDLNGDGKLEDSENLLAGGPTCGTVTEDAFGQKYLGSEGTASAEVIESGPMRVSIRARGKHSAGAGKGYSPGLNGYDVILNLYAGSSDVFADVVVTNNQAKSIGVPAMEDGSLLLKLADGAGGYTLLGDKPAEGSLAAGESVCLYQDSNGADTWQRCSGFGMMQVGGWRALKQQLTSFRGCQVFKRTTDAMRSATQPEQSGEAIGQGDHARGTLHAWNARGGMIVHMRNFWQQFPKAAEVAADGAIRVGLFPREWKYPHAIGDLSAKGHEIVLHFYGGKAADGYAKDAAGRPKADAVADCWDARVFARPTLAHMAAAGALSDIGPFDVPTRGLDKSPGSMVAAADPQMFSESPLYGNAFGWRIFGERWRSFGGSGTHGARQPIDQDNYLYLWYVTGSREWLAIGDARSRQFRDVRAYRVDDEDPLTIKDWLALRATHTLEDRARPTPDDPETRKFQAGLPDHGLPWEFPNPEHTVLDLLHDRYLLFGDIRSLENMRTAAAIGGLFARDHAPPPGATMAQIGARLGRDAGWSWRTLERYWELTGDNRADEILRATIKAYEPLIGKSPLWFANNQFEHASDWFTQIFTRAAAMTALHTDDPQALAVARSLAVDKEKPWAGSITYGKQSPKDARTFSTLFAVLYHLTGEEKYKQPLAEAIKGDAMLSVGGYYPASDHWLLTQPPRTKK